MAQEQPGSAGAMGAQVRVAIRDLSQAGQQVRAQAQNLEDQVISPLNAVESSHGATWASGSHAEYLRVHQGLVASLGQAQQTTHHMGATMEQSAGAYGVLNQTRFNNARGLPGDGADPFDTIRVAGARPLTKTEVEEFCGKKGIQPVPLSGTRLQAVNQARGYSAQAVIESAKNPDRCWGVDETGLPAVYNGYAQDRPLTAQIQAMAAPWQSKYGYDISQNAMKDAAGNPGDAVASHAEKLLAMRGNPAKVEGLSIDQCRDCRQFYWCLAQDRGVEQVVAGPDITRIYMPNGNIGLVFDDNGQTVMYEVDRQTAQDGLFNNVRYPVNRIP